MWHTELAAAVNAECPCDGSTESTAAPCCSSSRSCPTRPKRAAQNSSCSSLRARFMPTTIGSVAGKRLARRRALSPLLLLRCSAALGKHVPEGREHLGDDVAGRRIASALCAAPSITARASGHAGGKPGEATTWVGREEAEGHGDNGD